MPLRAPRWRSPGRWVGACLAAAGAAPVVLRADHAASRPAESTPELPTPIISRQVELSYRAENLDSTACIELWYTRDRGASWQCGGADEDRVSPLVFHAPADGLYGVTLLIRSSQDPPRGPGRFEPPQRWLLIDATPPLLQWDGVEYTREGGRRVLHLRWTAFDDQFPARPISLACQAPDDSTWRSVARELSNLGRYEWELPADLNGALLVKLTARDAAGNVVERIHGPIPLDAAGQESAAGPASRPVEAPAASTRPALTGSTPAGLESRQRAEQLYQQGKWHLARGQYAVAAQRLREAVDADADHLAARSELAGIYYLQRDYNRAIELYQGVLARDGRHAPALRGAALAYVAQKRYAQSRESLERLLAVNGQDPEAWLDLGDVLFMMGHRTEARSHWGKAATIDPAADALVHKARRRLELYASEIPAASGGGPAR